MAAPVCIVFCIAVFLIVDSYYIIQTTENDLQIHKDALRLTKKLGKGAVGEVFIIFVSQHQCSNCTQVWEGIWNEQGGGIKVAVKMVNFDGDDDFHKLFREVGEYLFE